MLLGSNICDKKTKSICDAILKGKNFQEMTLNNPTNSDEQMDHDNAISERRLLLNITRNIFLFV